jgi:hypothetical protein
MKKANHNRVKSALTILLWSIAFFTNAQDRPKVQNVSLRAPANVKIDGKLTEWPYNLQAYNFTNRIFYQRANDDDKLYLIIRTGGPFANHKVVVGGITFTVSRYEDKKERVKAKDNITITYPVIHTPNDFGLVNAFYAYQDLKTDTVTNKIQIDSLIRTVNNQAAGVSKEIGVTGIKEITDSTISVYNAEGIKASCRFNNKMCYVYELAIPLKYLGLSVNSGTKFSYNIKLNGLLHAVRNMTMDSPGMPLNPDDPSVAKAPDPNTEYLFNPTDFWGEYVLAKKP